MKILFVVILALVSTTAFAQEKLGVGVMAGNPTGLSAKMWLDDTHAIDAGMGFSFGEHSDFSLHSDYLLHNKGAFFFNDVHSLDLYYGIGGRMEFADDLELGVRTPVGLVHQFTEKNMDAFGEIAPILDFIGHKGFEFHILVGTRFYF